MGVKVLAMVSNGISAEMLRQALLMDGYELSQMALILQRPIDLSWLDEVGLVVRFDVKPSLRKIDQLRLLSYYFKCSALVRKLLRRGSLTDIYIANVDNLLSNHIVNFAKSKPSVRAPRISVVAEGFMNYQNITVKDRPRWRWALKPAAAALFGLRFCLPLGHLSGSEEPVVSRVFSYSATGLKAPEEKFVFAEFPRVVPTTQASANTALVVLTGIGQWMSPERFGEFKGAFADWVNSHGFDRVFVKAHPFYPSGGVEKLLNNAVIMDDPRRLEQMAGELPAQRVIGYCTTALVVLKLMRPDLEFTDWGSDFYCEHAYSGDKSIVGVLLGAGIDVVDMNASS